MLTQMRLPIKCRPGFSQINRCNNLKRRLHSILTNTCNNSSSSSSSPNSNKSNSESSVSSSRYTSFFARVFQNTLSPRTRCNERKFGRLMSLLLSLSAQGTAIPKSKRTRQCASNLALFATETFPDLSDPSLMSIWPSTLLYPFMK